MSALWIALTLTLSSSAGAETPEQAALNRRGQDLESNLQSLLESTLRPLVSPKSVRVLVDVSVPSIQKTPGRSPAGDTAPVADPSHWAQSVDVNILVDLSTSEALAHLVRERSETLVRSRVGSVPFHVELARTDLGAGDAGLGLAWAIFALTGALIIAACRFRPKTHPALSPPEDAVPMSESLSPSANTDRAA